MDRNKRWTEADVREILSNPFYTGIGPFTDTVDGEPVSFPEVPRIIDDETWIAVQVRRVLEEGSRRTISKTRATLHKFLGFKITSIAYAGWLNEAVHLVEASGAERFFRQFLLQLRPQSEPLKLVRTQVHFTNITDELYKVLLSDPTEIYRISPSLFEELICERLYRMGLDAQQVGKHTYHKDGGVDIVAIPRNTTFPFLMAVQVKHHRTPQRKTGPKDVRDLLGVVQTAPFNAGVLVTNTTFTADAQWVANQKKMLVRLRDMSDIKRWLQNNFLEDEDWRELPDKIEVCPGVTIQIPKSIKQ